MDNTSFGLHSNVRCLRPPTLPLINPRLRLQHVLQPVGNQRCFRLDQRHAHHITVLLYVACPTLQTSSEHISSRRLLFTLHLAKYLTCTWWSATASVPTQHSEATNACIAKLVYGSSQRLYHMPCRACFKKHRPAAQGRQGSRKGSLLTARGLRPRRKSRAPERIGPEALGPPDPDA